VSETLVAAGLGSVGAFSESVPQTIGMDPATYRSGASADPALYHARDHDRHHHRGAVGSSSGRHGLRQQPGGPRNPLPSRGPIGRRPGWVPLGPRGQARPARGGGLGGALHIRGRYRDDPIPVRPAQEPHHGGDGDQEDDAGHRGPEAVAAGILRLGEEVADRRAERAGEDVGEPEGEDLVHQLGPPQQVDRRDYAAEEQGGEPVAPVDLLCQQVAGGGPEREGPQDGQPVEGLPGCRGDAFHRQRALEAVPDHERDQQGGEEDQRRRHQRDAEVVGQVVRDQGADDADQHDDEPVGHRDVALEAELDHERHG